MILPLRDTEPTVTHARHPGQGLPHPPEWTEHALCAQVGGDLWYPEKQGNGMPQQNQSADAKRVCRRCPVTAECLAYALDNDEAFGVWGGLSARQRRKMRTA